MHKEPVLPLLASLLTGGTCLAQADGTIRDDFVPSALNHSPVRLIRRSTRRVTPVSGS
jgi:hypothetical protein